MILFKKPSPRHLHVFLCHSSGDKPAVQNLYRRLKACNIDPWLDKENLLPGQDWEYEIRKAVKYTDTVIVCLSHESIGKTGFVQKEIKLALDVYDEQPEGSIFLIPLKLEECKLPQRLIRFQEVNYFEESGFDKLISALKYRAASLMGSVQPIDYKPNSKNEKEDEESSHIPFPFLEQVRRNMAEGKGSVVVVVNSNQVGQEFHLIPNKEDVLQSTNTDWRTLIYPGNVRSALVRQHIRGVYAAVFEDLFLGDYLIWKGKLGPDISDPDRRRGITVHEGTVEEVFFE